MNTPLLPLFLSLIILGVILALLKPYIEPTIFTIILILLLLSVALYVLFPLVRQAPLFSLDTPTTISATSTTNVFVPLHRTTFSSASAVNSASLQLPYNP